MSRLAFQTKQRQIQNCSISESQLISGTVFVQRSSTRRVNQQHFQKNIQHFRWKIQGKEFAFVVSQISSSWLFYTL